VQLPEGEVHLWRARADLPEEWRQRFRETLTAEELALAERLRAERDRERYVCAQGVLRDILARYAGVGVREIAYRRNEYGKPDLSDGLAPWLRFNLTHSHDEVMVAVVRDREIGVDIEYIASDRPLRKLIGRFFSEVEVEAFQGVPEEELPELFYTSWTRKEAYVKARGVGLRFGMRRFAMTVGGDKPALLHVEGEPEEPGRWTVLSLDVAPEFRAALVVEGRGVAVQNYVWPAQ
jgi:4'-phosphopantetheinyl transferase